MMKVALMLCLIVFAETMIVVAGAYAWPWDTLIEKGSEIAVAGIEATAEVKIAQAEAEAQIVMARAVRDALPHLNLLASIVFGALCVLVPGYLGMQAFRLWTQFAADGRITRREMALAVVSALVLIFTIYFSFTFGLFLMEIAENGLRSLAG